MQKNNNPDVKIRSTITAFYTNENLISDDLREAQISHAMQNLLKATRPKIA
ncbi:MAG TPA: hypothetical protein VD815_09080 [Candidatus Saccharimonadales bacterium]|nr:hypothetical protein [Candidatus Saccharimonadales bacterium]